MRYSSMHTTTYQPVGDQEPNKKEYIHRSRTLIIPLNSAITSNFDTRRVVFCLNRRFRAIVVLHLPFTFTLTLARLINPPDVISVSATRAAISAFVVSRDLVAHEPDILIDFWHDTIDAGLCERDMRTLCGEVGRTPRRALEAAAGDLICT
jgi:hypothetical protein